MTTKRTITQHSIATPVEAIKIPSSLIRLSHHYQQNIKIRTMTFDEVEWSRVEWAGKGEGWSSSVGGLLPNFNQDNQGFYILELNGQKIGSISMITYNGLGMAFVGYYIIREPFRGKGFGRILMEEVLAHTSNNRGITTFGLNCVDAIIPMYEKYGFKTYTKDDFWTLQLTNKENYRATVGDQGHKTISSLPTQLFNYDKKVYGDTRTNFLQAVCSKPSTVIITCEKDGNISGYGVISERIPAKEEPHKSYRIGPLYANDIETAADILKGLISSVPETPSTIYLETPGTNAFATQLVSQFGFNKTLTTAKMYRGTPPKHDEEKIFCYSSVAFG